MFIQCYCKNQKWKSIQIKNDKYTHLSDCGYFTEDLVTIDSVINDKEYDANGNVKVHGVPAGHSGSVGVAINAKTQVPNAAWKFLEYIGGEYGQSVQSKTGFAIPLQKHLALDDEIFLQSNQNPRNAIIFIDAAENQKAGDWWY